MNPNEQIRNQLAAFIADYRQELVEKDMLGKRMRYTFEEVLSDTCDWEKVRITLFDLGGPDGDAVKGAEVKRKRFLCVNGPEAGKRFSTARAPAEYVMFNRSRSRRETDVPSAVFVHRSSFK